MNQGSAARRVGLWVRPYITVFDPPLIAIVGCLCVIGIVTLYSAGNDFPWRVSDQLRNFGVALAVMFVIANVSPQMLMRLAVPIYLVGARAAGRDRGQWRDRQGRPALARHRCRTHSACGDHEARPAADARVVLPQARRQPAHARFRGCRADRAGAGRTDHQAARSGHRAAGAGRRLVRDLLRRVCRGSGWR